MITSDKPIEIVEIAILEQDGRFCVAKGTPSLGIVDGKPTSAVRVSKWYKSRKWAEKAEIKFKLWFTGNPECLEMTIARLQAKLAAMQKSPVTVDDEE